MHSTSSIAKKDEVLIDEREAMAGQSEKLTCHNCSHPLEDTFLDLGTSPLCEEFVKPEQINRGQQIYPLHAYVCRNCLLVQVAEYVPPETIYSDYHYFSSYSDSWLQHASDYVDLMIDGDGYGINHDNFVVEIASNDGYLLQYFKNREIPILGVEPSENAARIAIEKGIPTKKIFFGNKTAERILKQYQPANLIIGNNVLAHVPRINDFIEGLDVLLDDKGIMTFEFPHLMQLMENNQFDTIYHEHFFYFSLIAVNTIFNQHGMKIFNVQELDTHGGSLRIFVTREENENYGVSQAVERLISTEKAKGYLDIEMYKSFDRHVRRTKRDILKLVIDLKEQGKTIAGYGAPGKGNTLLNYCGIRRDMIDYTVDRNPNKWGYYLPGSLIPIFAPDKIKETKPDYVFILPWNLKDEIMQQMDHVREWGGKFIIPIPKPVVT
jgi:hypothetical protein